MDFQAYPSTTSCRKDRNIFFKVQNILHSSDSIALPCCLLLVGSCLVLYQHMTDDDTGRHSVRNFLAKILVSMLPLVLLERKILACADPVGLFAKFSAKVLLMHACFLGLRLACLVFPDVEVGYKYCNVMAFVGACILLPRIFGLRFSLRSLMEHRDVLCLASLTLLVAIIEVALLGKFGFSNKRTRSMFLEDVILTGSDYIEILAFVPAVWMACRKDSDTCSFDLAESQRRAVCLFAFLTAFYLVEDVANAISLRRDFPLATCGHAAHFLLLLDFSTFLLAHLYDPEKFAKLKGAFLNWVVDACAV
mmetsp:Transcript_35602/g.98602  ORF Transcript_35602/g.98602 Transcript_35602/m.98602 type:complete len:307 (-) Transcript_35602:139-1059(-)|eukprot:CAMPEP_0179100560 /NCGR_PEP_ID=MMETSP0796-20121207/46449_1 /TAXON_ID=73915 /ORGANISM="Pyrodinium bahamense, Strain pbaha01" /LENGTH=306 /DNA_ID=CAMNT_0020798387 /DNA_START=97 /DNA_END=1017 /DNA_ORIENTATION=+